MKTTNAVAGVIGLLFFIYLLNRYAVEHYQMQDGIVWLISLVFFCTALAISRGAKRGRRFKSKERSTFSIGAKEYAVIKQRHRCASCNDLLNVIQYDHKNGDRSNNRKDNCQALCPNCHSRKTIIGGVGRK